MRCLLVILVFLAACPSTAIHSSVIDGLWLQREYTLNATQICQDAPELLECAERQGLYLLRKAVEMGYAKSVAAAQKTWRKPGVCLIEHQEPCCIGENCTVSSTVEASKLPRAACTFYNSTWIARRSADGLPYDYSVTLFWEMKSSTSWAFNLPYNSEHSSTWDRIPMPPELACAWRR